MNQEFDIQVHKLNTGVQAAYVFKNTNAKNPAAVTTVKIDTKEKTAAEIASWGSDNRYPKKVIDAIRKSGSGSSALRFLRKVHYGNGLILFSNAPVDGKKSIQLLNWNDNKEIADFARLSQLKNFSKESIADLEWFGIMFPEYILTDNYQKILRVKRHQSAWCRYGIQNDNGDITTIYISQKFNKDSVSVDSEYLEQVPHVDPILSTAEVKEFCKANGIKKFIRPVKYPLLDEAYYPIPEWHSVIDNGWLEVANSVPALKRAIFKNQISIKYIIHIDERYFEKSYKESWALKTVEERIEIRKQLIDSINDKLTGDDNAGKSIQSMKFEDDKGNTVNAIEIETIDDKFKDGSYLPEAEAANSEVLFALGVDPSLIGAGIPGGKLGAGSGSDKNAAFNILQALKKSDREFFIESLEFVRDYNEWDMNIQFGFEDTVLTTLDKNPTGTQTATA